MNSIWNESDGVQVRYALGNLQFFRTPLDALETIIREGNMVMKISFRIGNTDYRWVALYNDDDKIHGWMNQPMSLAINFILENKKKVESGEITKEEADELNENIPSLETLHCDDFHKKCVELSLL